MAKKKHKRKKKPLKAKIRYVRIPFHPSESVEAVLDKFKDYVDAGCWCPMCDRKAKVYKPYFTDRMLYALKWMCDRYRKNGGRWIVMPQANPNLVKHIPEYVKMRHWGFIEAKPRPSGHLSQGKWRPTPLAYDFIAGRYKIRARFLDFGGRNLGFLGDEVNVHQVRKTRFDPKHLED